MTRFTDRVGRDLGQIADHASPSSTTAWEAIRQRIDDSADEPTMEVIMLAPNDHDPTRRNRRWLLIAASVAAIALIGALVVASDRGADDNVPADQPVPSTPTSDPAAETDGELTVDPGGEQPVEPAPVVQPEGDESGEAAPAPTILADDTLPPVPLQATGQMSARCAFGNFEQDGDVSSTAPQSCSFDGDPLPVRATERITLTLFFNDSPTGGDGSNSFVSTSADGFLSAGYNYNLNESAYYVAIQPGTGEYEGETVFSHGRTNDNVNATIDWTIEPGTSPLPTSEEGGISAEVTLECTPTIVETSGDSLIVDQACTYTGDDARFVPAPEVLRTTLRTTDGSPYADQRPVFVTAHGDGDRIVAGVAEDFFAIRAVGVRPGTGEFAGMEIHDVIHYVTDSAGNLTGTMRSTVWPGR